MQAPGLPTTASPLPRSGPPKPLSLQPAPAPAPALAPHSASVGKLPALADVSSAAVGGWGVMFVWAGYECAPMCGCGVRACVWGVWAYLQGEQSHKTGDVGHKQTELLTG
jgi:hypothetical protein